MARFPSGTPLPFAIWVPVLKPSSRKKGTLISKGLLGNLDGGYLPNEAPTFYNVGPEAPLGGCMYIYIYIYIYIYTYIYIYIYIYIYKP